MLKTIVLDDKSETISCSWIIDVQPNSLEEYPAPLNSVNIFMLEVTWLNGGGGWVCGPPSCILNILDKLFHRRWFLASTAWLDVAFLINVFQVFHIYLFLVFLINLFLVFLMNLFLDFLINLFPIIIPHSNHGESSLTFTWSYRNIPYVFSFKTEMSTLFSVLWET